MLLIDINHRLYRQDKFEALYLLSFAWGIVAVLCGQLLAAVSLNSRKETRRWRAVSCSGSAFEPIPRSRSITWCESIRDKKHSAGGIMNLPGPLCGLKPDMEPWCLCEARSLLALCYYSLYTTVASIFKITLTLNMSYKIYSDHSFCPILSSVNILQSCNTTFYVKIHVKMQPFTVLKLTTCFKKSFIENTLVEMRIDF